MELQSSLANRAYSELPDLVSKNDVPGIMSAVERLGGEPNGPNNGYLSAASARAIAHAYSLDPADAADRLKALVDTELTNSWLRGILEGIWIDIQCRRHDRWQERHTERFGCRRFRAHEPRLVEELLTFGAKRTSSHRHIATGAAHFLLGELDRSYSCFEKAAQGELQRMYAGAYSIAPVKRPRAGSLPGVHDFVIHHRHERDFTILVAADIQYYRAFIHDLYHSIRKTEFGLHVHILNPTPNLSGYVNLPGVGYSSETCEKDISYYATARFLRAREIQAAYGTPILITDIDGKLKAPEENIRRRTRLTMRATLWGSCHVPWRTMTGSAVLVPEADHRFLKSLEAYIRNRFRFGEYPRSWWFDQQALFDTAIDYGDFDAFTSSPFLPNKKDPETKKIAKRRRSKLQHDPTT